MNKNVYDYFTNLDNVKLERENNLIILEENECIDKNNDNLNFYILDDKVFYSKRTYTPYTTLQAKSSAKLYSVNGILCPPIYLGKEKESHTLTQITEDITGLKELAYCEHPSRFSPYYQLQKKLNYSSNVFKSAVKIKNKFQNIMTDECFNDLTNMFLIDELRSEADRNSGNYYLYNFKDSDKYSGVAVFDFDLAQVLKLKIQNREDFKHFLGVSYLSFGLQLEPEFKNYYDRIMTIKKYILSGKATDSNIDTIRKTLEVDYPADIKNTGEEFQFDEEEINKAYTPISYMWEFNREMLGKDLGL